MLVKVLLDIGGLLALVAAALIVIRLAYAIKLAGVARSLAMPGSEKIFSEQMVADLPEPARRYFVHAIKPGTRLAGMAKLKMQGSFRIGQDAPWLKMRADQLIAARQGFIWKARIYRGPMHLSGADFLAPDQGQMRFFWWWIISIVNVKGEDLMRSAAGRLALESVWLPSSLLPGQGVKWTEAGPDSARCHFMINDESVSITIKVDRDGRLKSAAMKRWGDLTEDGDYDYLPFGGEFEEEAEFEGYTIPTRAGGGWWFGSDEYFEFIRAKVISAKFR